MIVYAICQGSVIEGGGTEAHTDAMTRRIVECSGMVLEACQATHPGTFRRSNQDRILALLASRGDDPAPDRALLAVADGVGGAPSGELASTIAVETLAEGFERIPRADPSKLLGELFATANRRIRDVGSRDPQHRGMACTLVAALVRNGEMWLASVGDSRAYLLHGGLLTQLTTDHSLAGDDSLEPGLRQLLAGSAGARHVLTRSLGNPLGVSPDLFGAIRLEIGDSVLLCSDGLYNLVSAEELKEALGTLSDRNDVGRRLVALANERGALDNVSAVVLRAASCLFHHAEIQRQ